MSVFDFKNDEVNPAELHPRSIGTVQSVDNGKVYIQITSSDKLQLLRIGGLVAIPSGLNKYIIGLISRIWRERSKEKIENEIEDEIVIPENNGALLTVVGSLLDRDENAKFSRTLDSLPGINEEIFLLQEDNLHNFMNVVSQASVAAQETPLDFGVYSLDLSSSAYLDGNRLFQRHASLLGSTGSGKSWTVARILEQANKLKSSNVILFDLHGEYESLTYADHYKIAGPSDLDAPSDGIMFLPYWLLSFEEIQALFVERSEFTAHNQVLVIHDTIKELKKEFIESSGKTELKKTFTIDTPVPYSLDDLLAKIQHLNTEMVPGANNKPKKGPFNGDFTRLLARLESKINDKKYGFLYQLPDEWNEYETLSTIASNLLGTGTEDDNTGVKVLNLSEVPSDVLPVVIGTISKLLYNLQFWTSAEDRHPLLLACDEAHLYLPKVDRANPIERSAIENVERIAKEGRKYGVGLMVISQRPSDVSETILSQCNNIISLRLTNPTDQNTVRKLLPDSLGDMMQILPLMDIGEAIVVGDAVLLPTRIKVSPPEVTPNSSTIQFWDEWGKEVKRDDDFFSSITESMRLQKRSNN